ncbi:MAG: AraC family transcriptional regulator [Paludibacter sp.]|nr:AraC family transcriptional regulator [Bacteroidales bacterium]MCM1068536.1 AraC family transcriptional regulator [Prevotella sp.]MCM1353200.1 AraC family transcriptional regulator [Bacteroides sp.]MCM1442392.1 AraC family transcriptional regulator [Muribaculum sp.]MCM1481211.1 AraC family transcriptional regulator [Paludibacter sp.]
MKKKEKEKSIPLLDCPVDYLVGDASGKIMNEYGRFPCKIKCGVYAYVVRGSAKATINITQYEFKERDVLVLEPGSFLLIHEFTEDALVYYILFSSSFLEKNTFNAHSTYDIFKKRKPIMHVSEEVGSVLKKMVDLLIEASNCSPSLLSSAKMAHVFNLMQLTYIESQESDKDYINRPKDRREEVFQLFSKLVLEHHHEWHRVARYAEEMRLTIPHLCSTIKSISNTTASSLIDDAIIIDAKSQLKITNTPIKEIAISLGFEDVAPFTRFFKLRTGMTPKAYRQQD